MKINCFFLIFFLSLCCLVSTGSFFKKLVRHLFSLHDSPEPPHNNRLKALPISKPGSFASSNQKVEPPKRWENVKPQNDQDDVDKINLEDVPEEASEILLELMTLADFPWLEEDQKKNIGDFCHRSLQALSEPEFLAEKMIFAWKKLKQLQYDQQQFLANIEDELDRLKRFNRISWTNLLYSHENVFLEVIIDGTTQRSFLTNLEYSFLVLYKILKVKSIGDKDELFKWVVFYERMKHYLKSKQDDKVGSTRINLEESLKSSHLLSSEELSAVQILLKRQNLLDVLDGVEFAMDEIYIDKKHKTSSYLLPRDFFKYTILDYHKLYIISTKKVPDEESKSYDYRSASFRSQSFGSQGREAPFAQKKETAKEYDRSFDAQNAETFYDPPQRSHSHDYKASHSHGTGSHYTHNRKSDARANSFQRQNSEPSYRRASASCSNQENGSSYFQETRSSKAQEEGTTNTEEKSQSQEEKPSNSQRRFHMHEEGPSNSQKKKSFTFQGEGTSNNQGINMSKPQEEEGQSTRQGAYFFSNQKGDFFRKESLESLDNGGPKSSTAQNGGPSKSHERFNSYTGESFNSQGEGPSNKNGGYFYGYQKKDSFRRYNSEPSANGKYKSSTAQNGGPSKSHERFNTYTGESFISQGEGPSNRHGAYSFGSQKFETSDSQRFPPSNIKGKEPLNGQRQLQKVNKKYLETLKSMAYFTFEKRTESFYYVTANSSGHEIVKINLSKFDVVAHLVLFYLSINVDKDAAKKAKKGSHLSVDESELQVVEGFINICTQYNYPYKLQWKDKMETYLKGLQLDSKQSAALLSLCSTIDLNENHVAIFHIHEHQSDEAIRRNSVSSLCAQVGFLEQHFQGENTKNIISVMKSRYRSLFHPDKNNGKVFGDLSNMDRGKKIFEILEAKLSGKTRYKIIDEDSPGL